MPTPTPTPTLVKYGFMMLCSGWFLEEDPYALLHYNNICFCADVPPQRVKEMQPTQRGGLQKEQQ